jgi:hypothetical protein
LIEWAEFFIDVCLAQVRFMHRMPALATAPLDALQFLFPDLYPEAATTPA